jgi:hypothetical protein
MAISHFSTFIRRAVSVQAKACDFFKEPDWQLAPAVLFPTAIANPRISAEDKRPPLFISCK